MITLSIQSRQTGKTTTIINKALFCKENIVYIFTSSDIQAREIHTIINKHKKNNYFKNDKIINICTYLEMIDLNYRESELNRKIYNEILKKENIRFFFDDLYLESDKTISDFSGIFEKYSEINELNIDIYSTLNRETRKFFEEHFHDYFLKNAHLIENYSNRDWNTIKLTEPWYLSPIDFRFI